MEPSLHRAWARAWLTAVLAALLIAPATPMCVEARADDAATARDILQAGGAGLCVHLGCGQEKSPALTAELAANSGMLVHGLALDDASLARAREAIQAKGVLGQAAVEKMPPGPLPFVTNLAGLVVIEDMDALVAKGVVMEEALRIVSPGGAALVLKDGKWARTVKPRPAGMDEWSHPQHGPDGNMVSTDRLVKFPMGFRWIDGVPKNFNRWASVRGWVAAGGRVYTLSSTEYENLYPGGRDEHAPRGPAPKKDHYLVARNAYSGLPLWKVNCGTSDDGAFLNWQNAGPLAADDKRAYAVQKDRPIGVDGATGQVLFACPTKYPPVRLVVLGSTLLASCWEAREPTKLKHEGQSLWATWVNKSDAGSVEAFDADTGRPRWSLPFPAQTIAAADGMVYLLVRKGNPPTSAEVVGVDLAGGRVLWRLPHTKFGETPDLQINIAGPGFVVVSMRTTQELFVLAAGDGKVLWEVRTQPGQKTAGCGTWTPLVDGLLWVGGDKRDPKSGEKRGKLPTRMPGQGCTPSAIIGPYITHSRGCGYVELPPPDSQDPRPRSFSFRAARGACMQGMVAANGMLYTAQNQCRCAPGQVLGFVAFGHNGEWPTKDDFAKTRPLEKGPAFGAAEPSDPATDNWPMYRCNPQRSSASSGRIGDKLAVAWQAQAAREPAGPLAAAWKASLAPLLTGPVSAGPRAYLAARETGQVLAYDAASGAPAWQAALGARIDSPPTLYKGLCIVGCHDGWVYALSASDGRLAWRTRVAPLEQRMVAYGRVESVWPVVGAVLVHDGTLYAHAGRSSEADGGVALAALRPQTGEMIWGKQIAPGPLRRNDILAFQDGALVWNDTRWDPKTGDPLPPAGSKRGGYRDTLLDAYLGGLVLDRVEPQAWNESLTFTAIRGCGFSAKPAGPAKPAKPPAEPAKPASQPAKTRLASAPEWTVRLSPGGMVQAMALVSDRVVVCGALPDPKTKQESGCLWVLRAKDGSELAKVPLPGAPVYDGLAVADGKAFVSLADGRLVCVAPAGE